MATRKTGKRCAACASHPRAPRRSGGAACESPARPERPMARSHTLAECQQTRAQTLFSTARRASPSPPGLRELLRADTLGLLRAGTLGLLRAGTLGLFRCWVVCLSGAVTATRPRSRSVTALKHRSPRRAAWPNTGPPKQSASTAHSPASCHAVRVPTLQAIPPAPPPPEHPAASARRAYSWAPWQSCGNDAVDPAAFDGIPVLDCRLVMLQGRQAHDDVSERGRRRLQR